MRPGIVLASFPVSQYALDLGKTFLNIYEEYFPDAVLYVGINPSSYNDQWMNMLKHSSIETYYNLTPDRLILNSDASAYQTALRLVKEKNIEHDILWFNHQKSVAHADVRCITDRHMDGLMRNRHQIEQLFMNDPMLGVYALEGWGIDHDKMNAGNEEDYTSRYLEFPYSVLKIATVYTFYAVRCTPVKILLEQSKKFLNEQLPHRYFFENDFCELIFRQGYIPYIEKWICDNLGHKLAQNTRERFDKIINEWRIQNHL